MGEPLETDEREVRHTEQVDVLVNGIASDGGEAKLVNELAANVDNLALKSTTLQGLGAGSLEVLWNYCLVLDHESSTSNEVSYPLGQHRPL